MVCKKHVLVLLFGAFSFVSLSASRCGGGDDNADLPGQPISEPASEDGLDVENLSDGEEPSLDGAPASESGSEPSLDGAPASESGSGDEF